MTAEQFIITLEDKNDDLENVYHAMREFAKYHVEEALKEALDSIPCLGSSTDIATYEEVEDAVLNDYPLKNIK